MENPNIVTTKLTQHVKPIIAIDGYSSCGKSTLAKALAKILGLNFIDSGAMYRAVALYFLEINFDVTDTASYNAEVINKLLDNIQITFKIDPLTHQSIIYLNNENVENKIRSMIVSDNVSNVSSIKEVRQRMVALQQKMGTEGGLVMDGRDIGTAVFPHADVKIFMTADEKVRATRRMEELKGKGVNVTFDEVLKNIAQRDYLDTTRKENPLVKADDAIVLDNTNLNREEQLEFVLKLIGR